MGIIKLKNYDDNYQVEYRVLWNSAKHYLPELTDNEIEIVVKLVLSVCPYCHESESDCQCWNDE